MASASITGERLHEDEFQDSIPGATPFFQVDLEDVKSGAYVPSGKLATNPREYLKNVYFEARNTPDVVVAEIDPQKMKPRVKTASYVASTQNMPQLPKYSDTPSKSWQKRQLSNFAIAREQYTRHLAKLKSISKQTKKRPKLPIYPLPPWDDEKSWKCLCFGQKLKRMKLDFSRENDEENIPKKDSETDVADVNDSLNNALDVADSSTLDLTTGQNTSNDDRIIELETLEEGFPPMMRILLRMDSNQVEANLEYHAGWLDEYEFSNEQGRWLYALLTCLEKPLFPTILSLLRDICRKCMEHRLRLNNENEQILNGLNLIICIIGRYFDQIDLADPW